MSDIFINGSIGNQGLDPQLLGPPEQYTDWCDALKHVAPNVWFGLSQTGQTNESYCEVYYRFLTGSLDTADCIPGATCPEIQPTPTAQGNTLVGLGVVALILMMIA